MPPQPRQGAYHSAFVEKYFVGVDRIKKSCIENTLDKVANKLCKGKQALDKNNKDVVQLIFLMMFITLLFPNIGMTILWDLIKHCQDLNKIGKYGWAKAIENFMTKSFKALKRKKNEQGSRAMGGCALLILESIKQSYHSLAVFRILNSTLYWMCCSNIICTPNSSDFGKRQSFYHRYPEKRMKRSEWASGVFKRWTKN